MFRYTSLLISLGARVISENYNKKRKLMFLEVKVCVFPIGVVTDGSVFTFMLHAEGGSTDVFDRSFIFIMSLL